MSMNNVPVAPAAPQAPPTTAPAQANAGMGLDQLAALESMLMDDQGAAPPQVVPPVADPALSDPAGQPPAAAPDGGQQLDPNAPDVAALLAQLQASQAEAKNSQDNFKALSEQAVPLLDKDLRVRLATLVANASDDDIVNHLMQAESSSKKMKTDAEQYAQWMYKRGRFENAMDNEDAKDPAFKKRLEKMEQTLGVNAVGALMQEALNATDPMAVMRAKLGIFLLPEELAAKAEELARTKTEELLAKKATTEETPSTGAMGSKAPQVSFDVNAATSSNVAGMGLSAVESMLQELEK